MKTAVLAIVCTLLLLAAATADAQVYNLRIVSDAAPDYTDMPSMVNSITSRWETPAQKVWALYYWTHIARRQTMPVAPHGYELTDPIQQYNDFGYTMCSTVSGINTMTWSYMGMKSHTWNLVCHTVSEVEYDGKSHVVDNAFSALYTLCDGVTLAGARDVGAEGACELSGGKKERGHIALYHCLYGTSPNGYVQGADDVRSLKAMAGAFVSPRPSLDMTLESSNSYLGHRYILNLRDGETYTRYFTRLDGGDNPRRQPNKEHPYVSDRRYYLPTPSIDNRKAAPIDPESTNPRYGIRGTGVWTFKPELTARGLTTLAHTSKNIKAVEPAGLTAIKADQPAEVVFRICSANITTSQLITAAFNIPAASDGASISVSKTNGMVWTEVWKSAGTGVQTAKAEPTDAVSGEYEILVKVQLIGQAVLKDLGVTTCTMFNSKTQPHLNVGMVRYSIKTNVLSYMNGRIFDLRFEGDYTPSAAAFKPIELTYAWKEVQADYSLVSRSHTQLVDKLPFKYEINVGGVDHPVMDSITVGLLREKGSRTTSQPAYGYSDGKDVGGERYVGKFATYGKNFALGKPYTMSVPNNARWSVKDAAPKTILTDGIAGANASSGGGIGWTENQNPEIVIDLGKEESCGGFRAQVTCGWPWWDAMKGQMKDRIEVLISVDGKTFTPAGEFNLKLHKKDLPVNYMLMDDETAEGFNFDLVLDKPVTARYVKFKVTSPRIMQLSELAVMDKITFTPFDMKLALPAAAK